MSAPAVSNSTIDQLAAEVAQATGQELPAVMDEASPTLRATSESFYLVGLIGGKEVGKSALVNALVGERISESTSYGPGTETIVAYAHADQLRDLRVLLDREVSGKYEIVPHSIDRLRRQVLLDLPDIDSQYSEHLELTRRMLRHMLFPVWVQSVEKYADQQPQKLLAAVAQGNDPANFLFALNKADQLSGVGPRASGFGSEDSSRDPLLELRDDYAARIARVLKLPSAPNVFVVSATQPRDFDFSRFREKLANEKPQTTVEQSVALAGRRHERSVLAWMDDQRLGERAARLKRLDDDAGEVVASRLTSPLLEGAVPRILDDPAHRAAIVDEVMAARVARWPVVNILHTLLWPLTSLWRQNVGAGPTPAALVAATLDADARPLSASIQATFALLQQTHPAVGPLYRQQKLWDSLAADAAAANLQQSMVAALEGQRAAAISKLARRGIIMPLIRWTLTIGAILWFPIVQPILELSLQNSLVTTTRQALLLLVQLFSAAYLLRSAAFLAIWFIFLWLVIRWDTSRRVNKLLLRWRRADGENASTNLAAATIAWADELLDPIHTARQREESLAAKVDAARQRLTAPAAA